MINLTISTNGIKYLAFKTTVVTQDALASYDSVNLELFLQKCAKSSIIELEVTLYPLKRGNSRSSLVQWKAKYLLKKAFPWILVLHIIIVVLVVIADDCVIIAWTVSYVGDAQRTRARRAFVSEREGRRQPVMMMLIIIIVVLILLGIRH